MQSGEGSHVPWGGRRCPEGCEPVRKVFIKGLKGLWERFGEGTGNGRLRSSLYASHSHTTHFLSGRNHLKGCQENPRTGPDFSGCAEKEEIHSEALLILSLCRSFTVTSVLA